MKLKRILALILTLAMLLTMAAPVLAEGEMAGKTVILHSNDVHGAIEGYAKMATLKAEYEAKGAQVILADAGDYSQGTVYVSLNKGADAVTMMNATGYDVATLGNHEFDYGYAQLKSNLTNASFKVLCANVLDESGSPIYDGSTIIEKDGVKIGFFGLETPEAQTKTNPALIRGLTFLAGSELYAAAQAQITALETAGADIIVCLSHLGVDGESVPNSTYDLLANTTGIDLVIDGHSHSVMTKGDNGEPIQSTGTAFANIGVVVIDNATKTIESNTLVDTANIAEDAAVLAAAMAIIEPIDADYEVVFASSEVDLNGAKAPGNRTEETNMGDLITDSMLWKVMQNADGLTVPVENVVAITNGGGIRAAINTGDITKKDVNTVLPFGNTIALVYVTGAELLEALEASTYCTPAAVGGFPQVAGIDFTVDCDVAYDANATTYPGSTYYGPASINRVTINSINGKAFDPAATYGVITNNFLAAGGDTYYAFASATSQFDTGIPMDEALMEYITTALGGVVTAEKYGEPAGRITIVQRDTEKTIVLYTNDVHTYIDGDMSYDSIAGLKAYYEGLYKTVILVDAGDHVQGTAYGSMDKGKTIIDLMNAAGYDAATLGNHEFDYGMDGAKNVFASWAQFPYLSANFYHESEGVRGNNVLDAFKIFDAGSEKIAIIGITTPESFTKSTPAYFQDGNGNYIYGISGGTDGAALYADVQAAIDAAKAAGATKVIALGHLGDDKASQPWTSEEVIANTTGLDAFIDGHSHSTVEGKTVNDKNGAPVLLTQTGEYFGNIGVMTIDSAAGTITTELISELPEGAVADSAVKAIKDAWISTVDEQLGERIGFTGLIFDNYDSNDKRLVRKQETNTGDFAADALYFLFDDMGMDVDVAIMNGGGVRNKAITGELTYKTCKEIHTFGNVACLQTVTGQQILDALEWGARDAGTAECGGFLQVSGLKYSIKTNVPSTVQKDDKGVWTGGPTGEYRVHDVYIYSKDANAWLPLDVNAKYNLAGYNYTLRDLGDGFAMFDGAVNVLDYVMEDYMVLANYIQKAFGDGYVEATNSVLNAVYEGFGINYATVNGSGRIKLVTVAADPNPTPNTPSTNVPATGDEGVAVYVCLMVLALMGSAALVGYSKKKSL